MSDLTRIVFILSTMVINGNCLGTALCGILVIRLAAISLENKISIGSDRGVNTWSCISFFCLLFYFSQNSILDTLPCIWDYFQLMRFRRILFDLKMKPAVIEDFPYFDAIFYSLSCQNECCKVSCSRPVQMFIKR